MNKYVISLVRIASVRYLRTPKMANKPKAMPSSSSSFFNEKQMKNAVTFIITAVKANSRFDLPGKMANRTIRTMKKTFSKNRTASL